MSQKITQLKNIAIALNDLGFRKDAESIIRIAKRMAQQNMSQEEARAKFMPIIINKGKTYSKFAKVKARPAQPNETIDTITSDGKETTNTANQGDYVVTNPGGEEYIISKDKLDKRYIDLGNGIYQAKGSAVAVEYSGPEIQFMASWGELMALKPGDMIVSPLPDLNEVYRIARKEFYETYEE
jgi:hypothetical protein